MNTENNDFSENSSAAIKIIKSIIQERQESNPRFSLRALATKMEVSSGRLSEILGNKRPLTEHYLLKICKALRLPKEDIEKIRWARLTDNSKKTDKKDSYGVLLSPLQIRSLVNWKPFAVMSLLQTDSYSALKDKSNIQEHAVWIANALKISEPEVQELLELMLQVHLLKKEDNAWKVTHEEANTGYDIPGSVIQESLRQDLDLAAERLAETPVDKRDYSSITVTLDPEDLPKAKRLLRKFRWNFAKTVESGAKKEVYQLSLQLFPLSKINL